MQHALLATLFLTTTLQAAQHLTPAPDGPYHVVANQILDSHNRPYLMRGTEVREFRPRSASFDGHSALDFGPHSATSLGAIRLRFNMNTVRIPLNILDSANPQYLAELAKLVRRAHEAELLVVLSATEPGTPSAKTTNFWAQAAKQFKNDPNLFFQIPDPALITTIRSTGATQPIIIPSDSPTNDPNVIQTVAAKLSSLHTETQRAALPNQAPLLVTGWDVDLDNSQECATLPTDPAKAAALVQSNLDYFDAHQISWTVSIFEPGKLIRDLSLHDATTLENGWTCGPQKYPSPGMGRIIQAHMRSTDERGFFVVSASGSIDIPRGGFAVAYGPVLAERDTFSTVPQLPKTMAGVKVNVTDSKSVTRPAQIYGVTAGWGQINFIIPDESATGPARMTLLRDDGSSTTTQITIADTAPGLWTGQSCRGAAAGSATQLFADGRTSTSPLSVCRGYICDTIAVPVAPNAKTTVRLRASGFRHAASASQIDVTIAGHRVPVVSYGPTEETGVDQVTIEIPASLQGLNEADLIAKIAGRTSNPVRIRLGNAT